MLWVFCALLCPTLCYPMDGRLPGSSVHRIFQTRILEWVAISFSRGSSWPRDWIRVSCLVGRFFTAELLGKPSGKASTHLKKLALPWLISWPNSLRLFPLGFPGGSDSKEFACNMGTRVQSLGREDPLEKGMATHSSILAWRIPWTEEPGEL